MYNVRKYLVITFDYLYVICDFKKNNYKIEQINYKMNIIMLFS